MKETPGSRAGRGIRGILFLPWVYISLPARAEEPAGSKTFCNTCSDAEETTRGCLAAEQTEKLMAILSSPRSPASGLDSVGQKVAWTSRRPQLNSPLQIVNTDSVNAFSSPGGSFYVNRGVLDIVQSESERAYCPVRSALGWPTRPPRACAVGASAPCGGAEAIINILAITPLPPD